MSTQTCDASLFRMCASLPLARMCHLSASPCIHRSFACRPDSEKKKAANVTEYIHKQSNLPIKVKVKSDALMPDKVTRKRTVDIF
eukprot:1783967-Pyramimonas_sp.AAC.1